MAAPHKRVTHKPSNDENEPATTLQPSRSGRDRHASDKLAAQRAFFILFILVTKSNNLLTVNEQQEASRQRMELKRLRAERQKQKVMKTAVPGLHDGEEEDVNERPDTMVNF